jgi:hypothetical protein
VLTAAAATVTPAAALAENGAHSTHLVDETDQKLWSAADPAIAAIARHRETVQAWLTEDDDELRAPLLNAERDAWLAWLTTPPTTLAGVIATLTHASQRAYADADYANLPESAHCSGDDLRAGERFPQLIAEALHRITVGVT